MEAIIPILGLVLLWIIFKNIIGAGVKAGINSANKKPPEHP